ncbi:MAG: thiamine-phosphate kinase [Chloroflexota bacterium]
MGEFELLARVRERLSPAGPRVRLGSGDDAAVTVPGGATATSVDAVVDGVHFLRGRASLRQIGHKALATALSDLAAMGAEAGEAYVTLGVPPDLDEDGCMELLDGMAALAEATGTCLAGGDVTRAGELFLAMTVVGHGADADAFVSRAGAKPGDALVLTGEVGGARAGHALLESADSAGGEALRERQLEPRPRLAAGRALAAAGATAMIDLSDGLTGDALHIAERSGVGLRIDAARVPIAPGAVEALAADGDGLLLALEGGEDYELLAALPPGRVPHAQELVHAAEEGQELTAIGEVVEGAGVELRLPGGRLVRPGRGFDQLA